MADRLFFDLRYVVPGYTFLLFVFLFITDVVPQLIMRLKPIEISLMGYDPILLGVVSFLVGPPLGFIVSQPWYILWRAILHTQPFVQGLTEFPFNVRNQRDRLLTVADYLSLCNPNETVRTYLDRRWNLMNVLGSEMFAAPLGFIIGLSIRSNLLGKIILFDQTVACILILTTLIELTWWLGFLGIFHDQQGIEVRVIRDVIRHSPDALLGFDRGYFLESRHPRREDLL